MPTFSPSHPSRCLQEESRAGAVPLGSPRRALGARQRAPARTAARRRALQPLHPRLSAQPLEPESPQSADAPRTRNPPPRAATETFRPWRPTAAGAPPSPGKAGQGGAGLAPGPAPAGTRRAPAGMPRTEQRRCHPTPTARPRPKLTIKRRAEAKGRGSSPVRSERPRHANRSGTRIPAAAPSPRAAPPPSPPHGAPRPPGCPRARREPAAGRAGRRVRPRAPRAAARPRGLSPPRRGVEEASRRFPALLRCGRREPRTGRTGTFPGAAALPLSSRRGKWLRNERAGGGDLQARRGGLGWGESGEGPLRRGRWRQHPAARERRRRRAAKCSGAAAARSPVAAGGAGLPGRRRLVRARDWRPRGGARAPRGSRRRSPPAHRRPHHLPPGRARGPGIRRAGTSPIHRRRGRNFLSSAERWSPGVVPESCALPRQDWAGGVTSGCGRQTDTQTRAHTHTHTHKVSLGKLLIKTMPLAILRHLCLFLPFLLPKGKKILQEF